MNTDNPKSVNIQQVNQGVTGNTYQGEGKNRVLISGKRHRTTIRKGGDRWKTGQHARVGRIGPNT